MKRAITIVLTVLGLFALLGIAGLVTLRTAWFREKLRQRVVAELEKATGGRVEIGGIRFDPVRWRARMDELTIHVNEDPGQKPLLQAGALDVNLKVVSFLKRQVDIAGLRLLAPEIRIQVGADGSTNIPVPQRHKASGRPFTEDLLDLAVGRFELERGVLWWNDERFDLHLAMSDLRAKVSLEQAGYAGRVEAGRAIFSSPPRLPVIQHLAASFQLKRDRIEIGEVAAKTAHSEWKAGGVISDLFQPRWQFRYEAAVDARDVAAALPLPELKAGRIQVRGTFDSGRHDGSRGRARAGPEWNAAGKFSARQVSAAGKEFHISDVGLAGDYHLDPRELRVENLGVKLLGGTWSGRLAAGYTDHGRPVRFSMQGGVEGIRWEAAAEALATPSYPLTRLGWTGSISGPLSLEGLTPVSPRNISLVTDLVLQASEGAENANAVGGAVRASYQGGTAEVQLHEVRLATAATAISASGRISNEGVSHIQFRLETSRLEDLTGPAAALSGKKIEAPAQLEGKAVLQGRLSGTLEQPAIDATLDVTRFAYEARHWDALTGRVQWSPQRLRLVAGRLVKGKTEIQASLTARLDDGKFTAQSPLEGEVSVRDAQVPDLLALAGQKLPLTGVVTATGKVQGTQTDPRAAGKVEVRRGAAWGQPFDSLRAAFLIEKGEVRWNNLQIARGNSLIAGAGALDPQRRTFRLDARGENLALSDLQFLSRSGRKVAGSGAFEVSGSGRLAPTEVSGSSREAPANSTLQQLALEGSLRLQKVSIDGQTIGDLSATARNDGDKLRVQVKSNFVGAQIGGDGEVALRDRFPVEGRLEFRDLKVSSVLRLAGDANPPGQISADGNILLAGDGRSLESLVFTGNVTRLELELPGSRATGQVRTLRNAEPVKWRLANQKLILEALHLVGEGSDLRGGGTADLSTGGALNLSVKGSLNLAALGSFEPKLEVAGFSTVDAAVTGTRSQPDVRGTLQVRDASIGSEALPIGLSRANGVVLFSRQRATVQKFTAEVGGGEVSLSGDVDFAGGPVTYRLRAEARQVRLRYPRGLSTLLEGTLNFTGTNQRSLLSGDIRITRAGTRASVDLGALLASLKQPARTPSSSDWLQGAQLNVSIATAADVRFETPLARNLQADANLRLRGTALNPALLGRINLTQGEFEFQGTRYAINRGDVTFSNPFRIDPILNLDLETRVSGYDITLTLSGPMQKLNVSYRSDPPLPFNEVITLLAVGRAPTTDPTLAAQQTAQARSLTQLGASTVIGQAIAKPVSGRLQRFFGVSRLKLDPELSGPEGNPNARVTLEQQVGKDITFTYIYNLASAQEQVIRVEWAINRQLSLIAVRDQNGVFGLDFLYKKRYR